MRDGATQLLSRVSEQAQLAELGHRKQGAPRGILPRMIASATFTGCGGVRFRATVRVSRPTSGALG